MKLIRSLNFAHLAGVLILAGMLLTTGCAAKKPVERVYPSWPYPPVEPLIGYVATYHGERDFKEAKITDALLGESGATGLALPFGVVAVEDRIYVSDTQGGRVMVIDPKNRKVTYVGADEEGHLREPMGIAASKDGTLYVVDVSARRVLVYEPSGKFRGFIGVDGTFERPIGIAVDEQADRVYVTDSRKHQVKVFSQTGNELAAMGTRGRENGEFNFPLAVAVDKANGELYVVDSQNHRVQVFDRNRNFLRKFGKAGDRMGSFGLPKAIAVDSEARVYVTDPFFHAFQVLTNTGEPIMRMGTLGGGPGQFSNPAGIFVDDKGKIYVVDSMNHRVQEFQYLSEAWKKENPDQYNKYMDEWMNKNKQLDKLRAEKMTEKK